MATDVDIKKLLEAGAHFGHKTERWHPKMAPYIHSKRGGTHIIDLAQTVTNLEEALAFITKVAASGKQILLVGTKRQAQDIVRKTAEETGMPFVTERWLGGMLTNTNTINDRMCCWPRCALRFCIYCCPRSFVQPPFEQAMSSMTPPSPTASCVLFGAVGVAL